jgi:hypothetical protein
MLGNASSKMRIVGVRFTSFEFSGVLWDRWGEISKQIWQIELCAVTLPCSKQYEFIMLSYNFDLLCYNSKIKFLYNKFWRPLVWAMYDARTDFWCAKNVKHLQLIKYVHVEIVSPCKMVHHTKFGICIN